MSENKDLLSRIGQLAGQINLHKTQEPFERMQSAGEPRGRTRPLKSETYENTLWESPRSSFTLARGRAGKAISYTHRNRTLVLKNPSARNSNGKGFKEVATTDNIGLSGPLDDKVIKPSHGTSWVSKRDRHMQLINSSVFDKEIGARSKAIENTRQQRASERNQREKQKLYKHLQSFAHLTSPEADQSTHEINIGGLHFQVLDGGSKLRRVSSKYASIQDEFRVNLFSDALDTARPTPKRAVIGGVTFIRSKHGNLYRLGLVKARRRNGRIQKIPEPCKRFSITGRCSKGPLCRYTHDPGTVAMCSVYLQTGNCPNGEGCDLSHDPTPERVPTCLHFLRGRCSKPECRYAHVRVNPSAQVCQDFSVIGFCSKGALCNDRHVYECPDWSNTGVCTNKRCRLPHVDRAGQIRKHSATNKTESRVEASDNIVAERDDNDLSSNEEVYQETESDDVDSDGLEEDIPSRLQNADDENFQGQDDYVYF